VRKLYALLLLLALSVPACTKAPPTLTPEAQIAWHATRVVKILDVVRDAAIAANELTPPVILTKDTRTVVLWHKTSVQVIAATPNGWKPAVKAGIYVLTCDPLAYAPPAPEPLVCSPTIPPAAVQRLTPYIHIALVVIAEVL